MNRRRATDKAKTTFTSPGRLSLATLTSLIISLTLLALLTVLPAPIPRSRAATPGAGAIGPAPGSSVNWMGQPYPTGHAQALPDQCPPAIDPANLLCDHFLLTVNVPPSHWDNNTGGADILIEWASADDDFDLYVYDNNGTQVGSSAAGGTTSERVFVQNASSAGSPYEVRVVPFLMVSPGLVGHDGTATFVSQAGGPAPNPVRTTGGLAFSPPATVVDAQRTEGEPINFIDKDGNYWESGPYGFSTGQSFIHRSTDGGNQFNIVSFLGLRPNVFPVGGGDTDVLTDDQGFVYFIDLEGLVNIGCAVSNDDGNNWRTNGACVPDTAVDRQWLAMDNGTTAATTDNTIFHAYRQAARGSFILSSPGSTGVADPIGGIVYQNSSADLADPVSQGAPCGQMRFDPVKRNLYYPCNEGDHINITVGHVNVGQRTGITYTNVDAPDSPGGGPVGDIFPAVATDAAGNLYAVWIDETDHNVYYAAAAASNITFDIGGNAQVTWGPARQINGNDANSNEFVWAQAGANGTLAVIWLGSSSHLDSDFMPSWYNNRPAASAFPWFGYASLIRNATSGSPTYAQAKFTDQPSHYGQICNQGLFCTVSGGDRTMADFLALYLDLDGSMRIVFNDTTSQHHGAHIFEVRQVAGPSAIGTTINEAVATNPVSDPTGDAQSPHYSPAGAGPNLPQFDFTKLQLSQPNSNTLRVQMTLAGPPGLPPAGETNLLWLTRFQALSLGDENEESHRIFYVGAESVGVGPPMFFAGSGDSANNATPGDGCVTTTPENCKIVQYPNEVAASGSILGNVITIDVPLQGGFGAGRPIFGDTLYNVTALSAGRSDAPPTPVAEDFLYADLDATRAFDFKLKKTVVPPGAGRHVTGGGAINGDISGDAFFTLNVFENLKGKISYSDAGSSVNFRSTKITSVSFDDATKTVTIHGTGVNNGIMVDFTVMATDNGEPGTSDTFRISFTGYDNNGTLIRGNIQIHES